MKLDNSALMKAGGVGIGAGVVAGILGGLAGLLCCCIVWLLYVAAGASYAYFAKDGEGELSAGSGALGGAIAGAVAGLTKGVVSGIIALLFGAVVDAATILDQMAASGVDLPPEAYDLYGSGFAPGIGGIALAACGALIFAAILGAIGGAVLGSRNASSTPAAV